MENTTNITMLNEKLLDEWKKDLEPSKKGRCPQSCICPNCGYCPHCGRGNNPIYYPYYYPNYLPYPIWYC